MRTFPILFVAVALPCAAYAQEPTNFWEQQIWTAYGKIQQDPGFQFQQTGTETVNGKVRNFSAVLYWSLGTDPKTGQQTRAYVELDDYNTSTKFPTLLHRYVGDGKTLWAYDLTTNRYSATYYSYLGKQPPADYPGTDAPRLIAQLYALTRGAPAYMVRLLQEINPGSTIPSATNLTSPSYATWAPGYTPGEPPSYPPTQDPLVPGRIYATGAAEIFILYPYPVTPNPTRSVAFQIDNRGTSDNPDWRLTEIYFADKSQTRFTDWTIAINDPAVGGGSGTGMYTPYTAAQLVGWQQLAAPRPFRG